MHINNSNKNNNKTTASNFKYNHKLKETTFVEPEDELRWPQKTGLPSWKTERNR